MKRFSRLRKEHNEHLARVQFDAYQDGVLTEAGAAAYRRHLASCPECQDWVHAHTAIAQQLRSESSRPAFLKPAAAARIQQNMTSRMRKAMIMNNMKAVVAGTAVVAVLALIVGLFAWQARNIATLDEVEPTLEIVTPEEKDQVVTPEASIAPEALNEQLVAAVKAEDAAEVKRLLEAGADPNAPDSDGNVLLPQAARTGEFAVVEALVNAGAHLEGLLRVYAEDPTHKHTMPALGWAARNNHIEVAEFLIARGADVNAREQGSERTPLHMAAWFNHAEMIELLLDNGANPDAVCTVFEGGDGTPLSVAIVTDSVDAVEALLDGGAEVDILSPSGTTQLMSAQRYLDGEIARLFLEHGADPNLQDDNGNTALHHAARWDNLTTIPLLVEYGASLDVQNITGKTPLDLALDPSVIELLQELGAG